MNSDEQYMRRLPEPCGESLCHHLNWVISEIAHSKAICRALRPYQQQAFTAALTNIITRPCIFAALSLVGLLSLSVGLQVIAIRLDDFQIQFSNWQ